MRSADHGPCGEFNWCTTIYHESGCKLQWRRRFVARTCEHARTPAPLRNGNAHAVNMQFNFRKFRERSPTVSEMSAM